MHVVVKIYPYATAVAFLIRIHMYSGKTVIMNCRTATFPTMISKSLYFSACTDVCPCARLYTQKELYFLYTHTDNKTANLTTKTIERA